MSVVQVTLHLPADLWHAVQLLAKAEGDTNTVVIRALEEYITATRKRPGRPRSGKYRKLVQALSLPVADLHLSARPATALHVMNIRYVHELVALEPRELRGRRNFGEKSFREVKDKLAALGLALGMALEDESYRAAVVATVAASIRATNV
jgi:DNA-directed RNA polymerase alpha subunit